MVRKCHKQIPYFILSLVPKQRKSATRLTVDFIQKRKIKKENERFREFTIKIRSQLGQQEEYKKTKK